MYEDSNYILGFTIPIVVVVGIIIKIIKESYLESYYRRKIEDDDTKNKYT